MLEIKDEGINELRNRMKKIGFKDKEIEEFVIGGLRRTGLLELYTLNGIDRLLLTPQKLELVVKERGNLLFEVLRKGRCPPAIQYNIIDGFLLRRYRIPVLDVLIQYPSEQLGYPTTFDEHVSRAKKSIFNDYIPVLKEAAISASSLASSLQKAQSGVIVQYHELLDGYNDLKESVSRLASTEPKILKLSKLSQGLDILYSEIKRYRINHKFKGRPSNHLVDLLASLNDIVIKLYEVVDYEHTLDYKKQTEVNPPSYLG
jgi:hypothetical protein